MPPTPGARSSCWPSRPDSPPTVYRVTARGGVTRPMQTSPTNIAAYLWSTLAAERLKLIGPEECRVASLQTLSSLEKMERSSWLLLNDIDPRTGTVLKISPVDSCPRPSLLSAVDNAWLAAALLWSPIPSRLLRDRAVKLLEPMDFRFFYDPHEPGDPDAHPGQLRVGYCPDARERTTATTACLIPRRGSPAYLGICRSQLPPEHYYPTLPDVPRAVRPPGADA